MIVTKVLTHSIVSADLLEEISNLKHSRWPAYTATQHFNWLKENFLKDNYHLTIIANKRLIGYANLLELSADFNAQKINVIGVGNVCTAETGRGYGNVVMSEVTSFLTNNSHIGLLLCKNEMIKYYEKFAWKVSASKLITPALSEGINLMTFNLKSNTPTIHLQNQNF